MKIKKLDKWHYYDLNNRIPNWWVWKQAYDQSIIDVSETEIWIDEDSKDFLILEYYDTPDAGIIPIIIMDVFYPTHIIDKYLENEEFINACGFKVIPDSRYDMVIPLFKWD